MRIASPSIVIFGSLTLLSAQALAQPQLEQGTRQDQMVMAVHRQPVQEVSDALGARLDHMMLDNKPVRQR